MSFGERYQIGSIPFWFAPFFWIYAFSVGVLEVAYLKILRLTCKFEIYGDLAGLLKKPTIHCYSHGDCWPYFSNAFYRGDVWINHPYWYMKPIHVMARMMGLKKIILGSTGAGGREASDKVVQELKNGHSTMMTPEGPHGPLGVCKKGILHMSMQSGAPIYFLQFKCSNFLTLSSWDQKHLPIPFSKIEMIISQPILVTQENFEETKLRIEELFQARPRPSN